MITIKAILVGKVKSLNNQLYPQFAGIEDWKRRNSNIRCLLLWGHPPPFAMSMIVCSGDGCCCCPLLIITVGKTKSGIDSIIIVNENNSSFF